MSRRAVAALALTLSLVACVEPTPAGGGASPWSEPSGRPRQDVYVHDGRRARRAILEEDEGATWRVLWTDPPPRPGRDLEREARWIFAGLELDASLRLPDGRVLPHPDVAELEALTGALDATGDVEAVVAGLPRLARLSSRGDLLARAAALEGLHPAALEVLFAACTTERARFALGRGPGSIPAGGDPTDALAAPLARLAARPEVGPAQGRALLAAARDLPRSSDRAAVLSALLQAPLGPVDAADALGACALLDQADRGAALASIARRLPLDRPQAAEALRQARELDHEAWKADVLAALAGKVDGHDLLDAASTLRDPALRRQVLAALETRD